MKNKQVKDLMVSISDYATIHENASMSEAIKAIQSEKRRYKEGPYRHQSLIVVDENHHVVGRVSQVDIMRAIEPNYSKLGDARWIGRTALSKEVLIKLRESFNLWERSLQDMRHSVDNANVRDYMQKPTEGEFVSEKDTCNVAAHRIVMGRHHSLLVTRGKVIVGVLRSTDIFNCLYDDLIQDINVLDGESS